MSEPKNNNISSSQLLCIYAIPSKGISQSELAKILCLDLSSSLWRTVSGQVGGLQVSDVLCRHYC